MSRGDTDKGRRQQGGQPSISAGRKQHAAGATAGATGMALLLMLTATPSPAAPAADRPVQVAQQGNANLQLTVPATILAGANTETVLPISIGPPDAMPKNSFVRLRGLPTFARLSEGHMVSPGLWAVPLFGLPNLKIATPADASGRSEVTVSLVSVEGALLAEARTNLIVGPAGVMAPPGGDKAPPADNTAPDRTALPARPPMTPEARARAEKFVAAGDQYLSQGNIAAARQFFERAAEAGLALAAMKLASTYDPVELGRLGAVGPEPNPAEARKWYEKARALGAPEAESRLARLTGR